jgi:hypothetical protein
MAAARRRLFAALRLGIYAAELLTRDPPRMDPAYFEAPIPAPGPLHIADPGLISFLPAPRQMPRSSARADRGAVAPYLALATRRPWPARTRSARAP